MSVRIRKGLKQMIDTVHMGIGPLGQKMVGFAVERGWLDIVGAVDPGPDKACREPDESYDYVHIDGEPAETWI